MFCFSSRWLEEYNHDKYNFLRDKPNTLEHVGGHINNVGRRHVPTGTIAHFQSTEKGHEQITSVAVDVTLKEYFMLFVHPHT